MFLVEARMCNACGLCKRHAERLAVDILTRRNSKGRKFRVTTFTKFRLLEEQCFCLAAAQAFGTMSLI